MQDYIIIENAREHNLQNISLKIPRDTLTVFTGVSGSGKSSLAFDTIYKEGQRRYVESLSAYARQYLGALEKPEVESIHGLSPTVCIDQKTVNRNPRSTVGTTTEIYDHLRLLYARLGTIFCPSCGQEIRTQSPERIVDHLLLQYEGEWGIFMAPLIQERKGEYRKEFEQWKAEGYTKVRIDGEIHSLAEEIRLKRYEKHTLEIVLDRVCLQKENRSRLIEAIEKAVALTKGTFSCLLGEGNPYLLESIHHACAQCGVSIPEVEPRLFSFNNPIGACEACNGLGITSTFQENLVVPNPELSIQEGAFACFNDKGQIPYSQYGFQEMRILAEHYGFSLETPWKKLPPAIREILLKGTGKEELSFTLERTRQNQSTPLRSEQRRPILGVMDVLERVYHYTKSKTLHPYMSIQDCSACQGKRLRPSSLHIRFQGKDIGELCRLTIQEMSHFFETLTLTPAQTEIARDLLKEIRLRLSFLKNVGLEYLTLARSIKTLSGGEAQRIRLARQVGSGLTGVLYVLDEPSIGLHARDNKKLLETLHHLKEIGNTVFVIEHDEENLTLCGSYCRYWPRSRSFRRKSFSQW
jgi:excinuclease ABC subunit A